MPWPAYSERFVVSHNVVSTVSYVVPYKRRAIIRDMTFVNIGGLATTIYVTSSGRAVFARTFPATDTYFHAELFQVVYGLGVIAVQTLHTGWTVHVSGTILDDPAGATGPPASALGDAVADRPDPEPLPSSS